MENKQKINRSVIKMNVCAGFTIVELVVVMVVVGVLTVTLLPVFVNALSGATMTKIGSRGKLIYNAIVSANSEREIMHAMPLWPVRGAFTNSTDYFRYLFDEKNYGKPDWKPEVAGFDYALLAGSGVPQCGNNKLTPAYNAWSVAECLTDEWDEVMPVLVTRNVDASSLASPDTITNIHWRIRFDTAWDTPFGENGMVLIRKNGAIFKSRAKYLNYANVYKNARQGLHRVDNRDVIDPHSSVSYLTPTGVVEPCPESYADGLSRQLQHKQHLFWRVSKDFKAFQAFAPVVAGGWVAGYLIFFIGWIVICRVRRRIVPFSLSRSLFMVAHYCVIVLYSTVLASYLNITRPWCPFYVFALAVITQLGLVIWAAQQRDCKAKPVSANLMCALSPPLIVCCVFWGVLFLAMVT